MLPNLGEPLILSTNSFVVTLTELSGLSFIGLGVQNPQYDFGRLLADALPNAYTQPIQLLGPSVMLVLTGAAAMFIGDGLAARSNPRLRRLIHGHHSGNLQVAAEYKAARTTSQEKPPVNESENEPNTTFFAEDKRIIRPEFECNHFAGSFFGQERYFGYRAWRDTRSCRRIRIWQVADRYVCSRAHTRWCQCYCADTAGCGA